jgi:glycosyltransferase involved in cell wall biosynthesis
VAPKKGPDLLLRAIAALKAEGFWDPATMVLVLAGPASGSYATELQHLAERLGISSSLHWTGMLQGDQKWGAFQSADAFVLPSHQENFGIAVAEALSCSTPVLLTHAVNIAAAGAGLVEHDTVVGITTLVRRWLALDPAARAAMATEGDGFRGRFVAVDEKVASPTGLPASASLPRLPDRQGWSSASPPMPGRTMSPPCRLVGACCRCSTGDPSTTASRERVS